MKKFMVLYMAPLSAMQQAMKATPEQMKASMGEWMTWSQKHKQAIVDMGAPLGKTKRVTSTSAEDGHNEIGGYSILQGESADEIAKMFIGHPHLKMSKDAKIEIVEIMPLPGM